MFEKIKFLEGLESVDGKNEIIWSGLSESSHEILKLNIVEDHGSNVGGVLLGHSFIRSGLNGSNKIIGVRGNSSGDLGGEGSGVVVSLGL